MPGSCIKAAELYHESLISSSEFPPNIPLPMRAETEGHLLYRSDDAALTWRLPVKGREVVPNVQQ